ncbi:MAG TPA: hypothetical protein VF950_19135 [Planctomycetota bacterium]
MEIVYEDPGGVGYHPVLHMARLAAELLEARLVVVPPKPTPALRQLGALLPRGRGEDVCLLICPSPSALLALLRLPGWRRRFGRVVAWVFDSFWLDRIPRAFRKRRHVDHVFVAEREDRDAWEERMRVPVSWLPWGSDVLRLGSAGAERPFDLLRVGRQPPAWEDDAATASACARIGLRFHGRPEALEDATDNQRTLLGAFARAKFTLSFSNSVNPVIQTHPVRRYLTGRWTDALAAGATVAGVPPESEPARALLWPEALLDLGTTALDPGLASVKAAAEAWTPERARRNHQRALERLDWRWRFARVARTLGIDPPALRRELAELRRRAAVEELKTG